MSSSAKPSNTWSCLLVIWLFAFFTSIVTHYKNQIAHCQYTCCAIKHNPTPKPDCLYHLGLKRQTAALKHAANTVHILLSAGSSETTTEHKQIHKFRPDLEIRGDVHRHEPWCRNAARKRGKFFWRWQSAWITLTFSYDREAVINSAMHLEDIYRKAPHTERVVITTINCLLPLSHFSCKGLLQLIMLKASYSSTKLMPLKSQGGKKILLQGRKKANMLP